MSYCSRENDGNYSTYARYVIIIARNVHSSYGIENYHWAKIDRILMHANRCKRLIEFSL